jgi:hypothetical protein
VDAYSDCLREEKRDPTADSRPTESPSPKMCRIERVCLRGVDNGEERRIETGGFLELDIWAYFDPGFLGSPGVGVSLLRNDGVMLYTTATTIEGVALREVEPNLYHTRIVFPEVPLMSGAYYFNISAGDQDAMQVYDVVERAEPFTVFYPGSDFGLVKLRHYWPEDR